MPIATINPANGQTLKTFTPLSPNEIQKKIDLSVQAFRSFKTLSFDDRAKYLMNVATLLEEKKQEYGKIITLEMGKTHKSAQEESVKCAWACRYYAENGAAFLRDEQIKTQASQSYVKYQPMGPVLAVMPWNFPFWQVFRCAAPILMAGNTMLLKHSSNVPQCSILIEEIFREAGFPEGVFQSLLVGSKEVEGILKNPAIKAATLTGSEHAGSQVASTAGSVIKPTVLELGGSDAFIVMPSADLDQAVEAAVKARTISNGQSCIAGKRFIVHKDIYPEFSRLFVGKMRDLIVGDPMDEKTQIGPLATATIRDELHTQVQKTLELGAELLTGGNAISGPGYFYAPTVLSNVPMKSPAYREETFGPVATLFQAQSTEDAIRIANDTQFGLGSSVWTKNEAEQKQFIEQIEAGQVFINALVASDPRVPFGGIKSSGYGRELGIPGIRSFTHTKTVWVA